jgi:hypothetical protein
MPLASNKWAGQITCLQQEQPNACWMLDAAQVAVFADGEHSCCTTCEHRHSWRVLLLLR